MKSNYSSILNTYIKLAQGALDSSDYKTLSSYAFYISERGNDLLIGASADADIDSLKLRMEIFRLGKIYIYKFNDKVKDIKEDDVQSTVVSLKLHEMIPVDNETI